MPEPARHESSGPRLAPWIGVPWVGVPLAIFCITRVAVVLVAYFAGVLLPDHPEIYHLRGTDHLLLDVFGSRWDTGFYVSIVEEGYRFEGVELPSVAFFPMLPILMGLAGLAGMDPVVAGILISNLALLGAAIFFYRWADREWGGEIATRALWYLMIFPVSFFGSAIYTESLFLFLVIGALERARRGDWLTAGLFAAVSSATRLHGVVVAALLLAAWWEQRRAAAVDGSLSKVPQAGILAGLFAPAGLGFYMAYLQWKFNNPLAFADAVSAWGRVPKAPFETLREVLVAPAEGWLSAVRAGRLPLDNWIDVLAVMIFLVMGCVLLAEKRWAEGLYVVLGLSLSFGSGLLMSQRRYVWILFPVFVLMARWGQRPWVDRTITTLSLMLLALFTSLFANGYWVA